MTNSEPGKSVTKLWLVLGLGAGLPFLFQNCRRAQFHAVDESSVATLCGTDSCSLTPLTKTPAVTTILLALGDESDHKLVGNPVSNQYLAESVIRFSSPQVGPKILIVRALNNHGEDPEDTVYIQNLLARYSTDLVDEPADGLKPAELAGYDVIWFNNPGYPHSSKTTYETLLAFAGAVVLQGDDMAWAEGFSVTDLTGLKFADNGTSVVCGGKSYRHDNNQGYQYRVTLDPQKIQGLEASTISFRYGNDIDNTSVVDPSVDVLAVAKGGPDSCSAERPVVVRRLR